MITLNETGPDAGRFLYTVYETGSNAGIMRYDLHNDTYVTLAQNPDYRVFDASYWTPWGTFITAEERTGGRFFEVTNPLADPADINVVQRTAIARVSHEGVAFDEEGAMYFIDEFNGGGIYKFVPNDPNSPDALTAGQTFVLKDSDGTDGIDLGEATWVALNNADGSPIPGITNPLVDGRTAANDVGATDYLRPEDLEIKVLANGHEALFVATTTDDRVLVIDLDSSKPTVANAVSDITIDAATGLPVDMTFDSFSNPDNLAMDAWGRIYIIEDAPSGDIWTLNDADNDGIAESISRVLSLATPGSEPTGLYFSPFDARIAWVNVQHPTGGNDRMIQLTAVPELSSIILLAMAGFSGMAYRRRRSA